MEAFILTINCNLKGFYKDIYPKKLKNAIHCPESLLAIANETTTQFLIVLDFVEGCQNVLDILLANVETRKTADKEAT